MEKKEKNNVCVCVCLCLCLCVCVEKSALSGAMKHYNSLEHIIYVDIKLTFDFFSSHKTDNEVG